MQHGTLPSLVSYRVLASSIERETLWMQSLGRGIHSPSVIMTHPARGEFVRERTHSEENCTMELCSVVVLHSTTVIFSRYLVKHTPVI